MAWIGGNRYLNQEEMENNAIEFANILLSSGATLNFVAGMLGNIQSESTVNPQLWEQPYTGDTSRGYGLVQWTPMTKLRDWCEAEGYDYTDGTAQCKRIIYEKDNSIQWIATTTYPLSFSDAWVSTESPEYLASAFLYNYERPADPSATVEARRSQANAWYSYLSGQGTCPVVTPRLTDAGMLNNPYWYSLNPFYQAGVGLPNCTCYSWGRRYEIMGEAPDTSTGNADTWYDYAVAHGQQVGQTPRVGAIMVWKYTGSHAGDGGHVAIVEEINGEDVTTSNSAYGGSYFYTQSLTAESGYEWSSYTDFQGFIYLPCGLFPPTPEPTKKKGGMPLWMYSAF